MLRFYEDLYTFEQKGNGIKSESYSHILKANIIPDKSGGLNFMSFVTKLNLLLLVLYKKILMVIPIKWSTQGTSDFVDYSPPNHLRKMSPGHHRQLGIHLENVEGDLIPFDVEVTKQ